MARADVVARIDEEVLGSWLARRRWFASKAREVAHVNVLDVITLQEGSPTIVLACLEARFLAGTHEIYQALLGVRPAEEGWDRDIVCETDGSTIYDAIADPEACALLGRLLAERAVISSDHARLTFNWLDELDPPAPGADARPLGAEQSNSSILFDQDIVLKLFRRMEPGENPEREMLRFLTGHGFDRVPALGGWYEYTGDLMDSPLGVAQRYIPGRDGWLVALDMLGSDPEAFLADVRELGAVIGEMHSVLASDSSDPTFAPEEASVEMLALLTATIDEEIQHVFDELPDDLETLEPIVSRGEEIRDTLRLLSQVGVGGRVIRIHGDLHLGQTLRAEDPALGWIVLDFEGEPARPVVERRRKRSPLRDVAGLLRSISYVASASLLQRGVAAPEDWEERARAELLEGYRAAVDSSLLPPPDIARTLLTVFELEKAVYELQYELDNRPDWVRIPVAGITRLMEPAQA